MTSAGTDRALPAPFLGTITFLGLSCIVPLLIVGAVPDNHNDASAGAAWVSILAGARFSWIIASRHRHIVEMVVWLFVYGFLGIAPMTQLRMGIDPGTTPNLLHDFSWPAIWVILAGMVCIMAGSTFAGLRNVVPASTLKAEGRVIASRKLALLTLIMLGVTGFYVASVGVANFFGSRDNLAHIRAAQWADPTVNALLGGVASMGLLVAGVAQILLWKERKRSGAKKPLLLLLVTVTTLLLVINPMSSPRYVLGVVYLALLAALGVYSTMRRYRALSLGALLGLFFIFPIADAFRRSTSASVEFENPLKSLLSGDFDSFGQINNALNYVHVFGIEWGQQLLGVVFFWVPRSIWPGKPIDTGILLAEFRGYSFTNLSAPLWGELFINGGWALLVAGMLLLGYFVRSWDRKLDHRIRLGGVPTVLGSVIPFYLLIVLRGSLLQSMASLAVIVACTWFASSKPGLNRLSDPPRPHTSARELRSQFR